jgi:hypothetical protein
MCLLFSLFIEPSYFSYLISYTSSMIIVQNEWHICIHPSCTPCCGCVPCTIIRFVTPFVFKNKLEWSVCPCLTQLYWWEIYIYRIYYMKINYMFRPLTMAIFRLRMKNLVSSYTRHMWAVYSGEVRGEVGTRFRMCCVGWVVWVHGVLLLYVMTR